MLVDRNPVIAGLWRWLTRVSADEILALPLLPPGGCIDELELDLPARWLIGFWLHKGSTSPGRTLVQRWGAAYPTQFWSENIRARIAAQLNAIRHWRVLEGSYADLANVPATWFIDPPYIGASRVSRWRGSNVVETRPVGARYRFGPTKIDFEHLSAWCRTRVGQTIVCENVGAVWLPFEPFHMARANVAGGTTHEAIWTGGCA